MSDEDEVIGRIVFGPKWWTCDNTGCPDALDGVTHTHRKKIPTPATEVEKTPAQRLAEMTDEEISAALADEPPPPVIVVDREGWKNLNEALAAAEARVRELEAELNCARCRDNHTEHEQ